MGKISISPTFKFAIPNQGKLTSHEIKKFPTNMCLIRAQPISTTSSTSCTKIPSMEDILESSRAQKLDLNLQKLGPFFRITATNSETKTELGRVEGLIRVWLDGKILHLDSIRLKKETTTMKRSIFGVGVFLGAVAVRHGFDSGCDVAQLLAINDTDLYHSKLVKFYSRVGFKAVHEVDGSSIGDLFHMLVWGGRGTRMNANIDDLLVKWCTRFNPKS